MSKKGKKSTAAARKPVQAQAKSTPRPASSSSAVQAKSHNHHVPTSVQIKNKNLQILRSWATLIAVISVLTGLALLVTYLDSQEPGSLLLLILSGVIAVLSIIAAVQTERVAGWIDTSLK
jgi:hypothetical protein